MGTLPGLELSNGFPFLSVVLGGAVVATTYLAYVGYRRRDRPGARTFVVLAVTMASYAALYAVSIPFELGPLRRFLGGLQWLAIAPLPVAWLLFAFEYSGRTEYLTNRIVLGLSVVPAIAAGAAIAHSLPVSETLLVAQFGDLFYPTTTSLEWAGHTFVSHGQGPLYLLYIAFAYTYFVAGVAVLFEFVVRFDRLYRAQAATLVVGALFPWIGNVVALVGAEPIPGLDLLPFLLPVTAVLFANALFRYDLLEFAPATRRRGATALVRDMRDAVVVVDGAARVVDLNPAAAETFGVDRTTALGDELADVAAVSMPEDRESFEVTTDGAVYEVTVSPVRDRYESVIGQTLVFRNITEHRDAQQRLEVLNRVLRHNLRTEVNVISGYASMIERELPPEGAEMASEISTAAGTLDELGQKAREVERIMSRDVAQGAYELDGLLDSAAERVETEHDDVEVDVYAPSGPTKVAVDAVVFEAVVRDLVDALVHYGDDEVVSVSARVAGSDLSVRASESGDGIPASEYEVVRRGEETPLEHASGLSLWLVKWGVRALDGEVVFDDDGDAVLNVPECVAPVGPSTTTTGDEDASEGESVAVDGGE